MMSLKFGLTTGKKSLLLVIINETALALVNGPNMADTSNCINNFN